MPAPRHAFDPDWRALTSLRKKEALFATDSFFREGLSDAREVLQAELTACVSRTALVLFKPDAVAGRRVAPATQILRTRGFEPVAAQPVRFDGPLMHALWRYQFRRGTIDKIRLYTRWAAELPTLVIAYADVTPLPGIPASVRMKTHKGPALVHKRRPDDVRSLLKSPNSIANFMHSADEPADVLREIAILVPSRRRPAFLAAIRDASPADGARALGRLLANANRRVPPNDVDPRAAGLRLRAAFEAASLADPARTVSMGLVDAVLSGASRLSLRAFENALASVADRIDPLDVFTFGTQFIERDIDGETGELDDDCVPGWLAASELRDERAGITA